MLKWVLVEKRSKLIAANDSRRWVYHVVIHMVHSAPNFPLLLDVQLITPTRRSSFSSARLARSRLTTLRTLRRTSDLAANRVHNEIGQDDLNKLPRVDGANHTLGLKVRLLHDEIHDRSSGADSNSPRDALLPGDLRADGDLDGRHGGGVEPDLADGLHVDALGQLVQEVLGRLAVRVDVLRRLVAALAPRRALLLGACRLGAGARRPAGLPAPSGRPLWGVFGLLPGVGRDG